MLRRFKIKTRLLLSFFIAVFFALVIGFTGFASLTSLGDSAVRTITNVRTMNNIYDYNVSIDAGLFNTLYMTDTNLREYVLETTKDLAEEFMTQLNEYLEFQDQFSNIFTPGEMQDMANMLEIYEETYVPIVNDIFDLIEQGRREEALSIYTNRFVIIFDTLTYYIGIGFTRNLDYSLAETDKNNRSALINAYLMLAVVLLSLVVSVALALAVTKSIAVPLSELGASAEKVARGELDVQFEQSQSNDEIAQLSQRLSDTLQQLNQAQVIKLEAIEARHEKEKAEASVRSKGEFLAKMSHEIRTPMNAITGMAELALREDMPDLAREHVLTIKQAGAHLLSIINDILDFSKIESGKLEIIPVEYLFSSLINDVISIIRMRVIDSSVLFVTFIDCNIPNALFGDEARIRQILLNILTNAVKFTEKGFVSLSIVGKCASRADGEDIVTLTIDVEDTGKGIKQEDLGKLFGEFVQIDLGSNRGIEGTGLGLAITKSLVKAMDGDISVKSQYGKGSVFTVTLPQKICQAEKMATVENPGEKSVLLYELRAIYADSVVRVINNLGVNCKPVYTDLEFQNELASNNYPFVFIASSLYNQARPICSQLKPDVKIVLLIEFGETIADQGLTMLAMPIHSISVANALNGVATATAFSATNEATTRFTAPGARVLIVDDISTNLKVAEGLLLPYKMRIDLCSSGLQAIEAVKFKHYDLVFMDHMMPEMDGIEATAAIRAWEKENLQENNGEFAQLPIVALTANVISGMRETFMAKGFNDLLAKPIDVARLDEVLNRWIPREKRELGTENKEQKTGKAETSEPLPIIPGIDTKRGIEMTGGTLEMYRDVLAIFRADAEERLAQLQTVPDTEGLHMFVIQVHALKSAASSIGATKISARAKELEEAGRAADMELIREQLPAFSKQLAELTNGIRLWEISAKNQKSNEQPATAKANDQEAIASLLNELASALESLKVDDIDRILDELKQQPLDPGTVDSLKKISDEVLMAEYDKAAETVRLLLGQTT